MRVTCEVVVTLQFDMMSPESLREGKHSTSTPDLCPDKSKHSEVI